MCANNTTDTTILYYCIYQTRAKPGAALEMSHPFPTLASLRCQAQDCASSHKIDYVNLSIALSSDYDRFSDQPNLKKMWYFRAFYILEDI